MEELSLHILDMVENSLAAGAKLIRVEIEEDPEGDTIALTVADDGRGMDRATSVRALDPFFTTRATRRVGLGLSLLQAAAQACGGDLELESDPDSGTRVRAWFRLGHIDRQPLGDWPGTLAGLLLSHPEVDLVYRHRVGGRSFELDTRRIKSELGGDSLGDPAVVGFLRRRVAQALEELGSGA